MTGDNEFGEPGQVLWTPSPERIESSKLTAFARRIEAAHGERFEDYESLWRWSVEHLEEFWAEVWDFFDVAPGTSYDAVLADRSMPGAVWFPGARLNYAEHVLRRGEGRGGETALVSVSEDGTVSEVTWAELTEQVGAVATALRRMGVQPGERVVGYLPNIPQAVVAFLAAASVGAVWSACGPEIGLQSAVDRFAQLEPVLLIACDGYRFGGRTHDRRDRSGVEVSERLDDHRVRHLEPAAAHRLFEELPVLGPADDVDPRAEQLDAELLERARGGDLHREV